MEQNTLLNVIKYKVYDPQLDEKVPKTNNIEVNSKENNVKSTSIKFNNLFEYFMGLFADNYIFRFLIVITLILFLFCFISVIIKD